MGLPSELRDAVPLLALSLLRALRLVSCPCLSKASSWKPTGPTDAPGENGHSLRCDLVDVQQLPSWPTLSAPGVLGRASPTTTRGPPSAALVPSLILSYLLGLCVQFQGTKDPCFPFPRPTLQTSSTLPSLPQFHLSLHFHSLPFFMVLEESVSGGRAVVLLLGGPPDAVFLMETSNQERHPPTHPPSPWAEGAELIKHLLPGSQREFTTSHSPVKRWE